MSHTCTEDFYSLDTCYDDNKIILIPRDPHCLFAYWNISEDKKNNFIKDFGESLWDKCTPSLKITNSTKNYCFYVDIKDSVSSCYIQVEDANCSYIAEIGKRVSKDFFINIATSNCINTPGEVVAQREGVCFINIKDVERRKFIIESYDTYNKNLVSEINSDYIGTSSMEVIGISSGERLEGNSVQIFGVDVNLPEYLGISSHELVK